MNKRVQNLLLFFILFLIIVLVGFNFALDRYGAFWEKMKFFQPKEVLIGQDFIGLPEEKILITAIEEVTKIAYARNLPDPFFCLMLKTS